MMIASTLTVIALLIGLPLILILKRDKSIRRKQTRRDIKGTLKKGTIDIASIRRAVKAVSLKRKADKSI